MQTKQAQNEDVWLSSGQAAALVGISRDTIKRYEKRGLLIGTRTPSGHRRFRKSDVIALMEPKR